MQEATIFCLTTSSTYHSTWNCKKVKIFGNHVFTSLPRIGERLILKGSAFKVHMIEYEWSDRDESPEVWIIVEKDKRED